MAKKVNWVPNLRVDIADLEQGTHGYSDENINEFKERVLKDSYPRIAEGFRVEIADAAARTITVYSGVAVDQNGQLVTNEEALSTSRSLTLGGDATYYIEVEFSEVASDTDARALWDSTHDNGTDTSGDVLPDGREASQSIATRKTHDWVIVSPPSTSGFQVSTTPGSTRIPVAVITVAGGAITAPTTSPMRTCFARTHQAGVTSIRLLNTRNFPDAFDARLGSGTANSEDLTVTANDREHGILTLGAATANPHNIGERLVDISVSALDFIDERVLMDDATDTSDGGGPIANTAGDARLRMFQGDTEAGYSLSQDPSADTGSSDLQVKNLKEYVDFLASQLLEMKVGEGSRDLLGTLPPPSSFSTFDHFERSGGIIPSRAHTVSVGNGVDSWGDFNTTTSGSAQAAIQAAHDALPANGGILYIKHGIYEIVDTPVSISKNVALVGDGLSTIVRATGTAVAVNIDTTGFSTIRNMSLSVQGGTSDYALEIAGDESLEVTSCLIFGINISGSLQRSKFTRCEIRQATASGHAINGDIEETTHFDTCSIISSVADAAARCLRLTTATLVSFTNCTFSGTATQTALIELPAGADRVSFDKCTLLQSTGVAVALSLTAAGGSHIHLTGCEVDCIGGLGDLSGVEDLVIEKCSIAVPEDGQALRINDGCEDTIIRDCTFTQASTTGGTTGTGILISGALTTPVIRRPRIIGNSFLDCDKAIEVGGTITELLIDSNLMTQSDPLGGADICRSGIDTAATGLNADGITITNNVISHLKFDGFATLYAINLDSATSLVGKVVISGNTFTEIGQTGVSTDFRCVSIQDFGDSVVIEGNIFEGMRSDGSMRAVFVDDVDTVVVSDNVFKTIGTVASAGQINCVFFGDVDSVTCTGNSFQNIGSNSNTAVDCTVIRLGNDTSQSMLAAVSNNTVRDFRSGSNLAAYGIFVNESFSSITISGNNLEINGTGGNVACMGIYLETDDGGTDIADVTISGNTIRGNYDTGIRMFLAEVTASHSNGRFAIIGNTISEFENTGIGCFGGSPGVDIVNNLSVANNVIHSSRSGIQYGIYVDRWSNASICGNSVIASATSSETYRLIRVSNLEYSTVTGNSLRSDADGATKGIQGSTIDYVSFSGNTIYLDATDDGSEAIDLDSETNCVVSGNRCHVVGFTGAHRTIRASSADTYINANYATSGTGSAITGGTTVGDNKTI